MNADELQLQVKHVFSSYIGWSDEAVALALTPGMTMEKFLESTQFVSFRASLMQVHQWIARAGEATCIDPSSASRHRIAELLTPDQQE